MTKKVKKVTLLLTMLVCLIGLTFGLVACDSQHEHAYGEDYKYNAVEHWHECEPGGGYECTSRSGVEAHKFGEIVETEAATCMKEGKGTVTCACGYSEVRTIPKKEHKFDDATKIMVNAEGHSYICANEGCGAVQEFTAHTADEPEITPATAYEAGKSETHCSVCGYLMEEKVIAPTKAPVTFDLEFTPMGEDFKAAKPEVVTDGDNHSVTLFSNGEGVTAQYKVDFINAKNEAGEALTTDDMILGSQNGNKTVYNEEGETESIYLYGSGIYIYLYDAVKDERKNFSWDDLSTYISFMENINYIYPEDEPWGEPIGQTKTIQLNTSSASGQFTIVMVYQLYTRLGDEVIAEYGEYYLDINCSSYSSSNLPIGEVASLAIDKMGEIDYSSYVKGEPITVTPADDKFTATVSVYDGGTDGPPSNGYFIEFKAYDADEQEIRMIYTDMHAVWVKGEGDEEELTTLDLYDGSHGDWSYAPCGKKVHFSGSSDTVAVASEIVFEEAGTYTIRFESRKADGTVAASVTVVFTVE